MRTSVSTLAMACLLVAAAVVGPAAAATVGESEARASVQAENESNVTAGQQLAGVIGVQGAEVEGEVAERSLATRLDRARGPNETAAVVASEYQSADDRLAAIRERKAELTAARDNGSISEGEYRARMATLVAETSVVERLANRTATAAEGLPAEALEARGVNADAIRKLATDARNLTGPEVAAIARGIAGNQVGQPTGVPAGERGPGERGPPENRTDDGEDVSDGTEERIETARDRLGEARDALEDAKEDPGADSAALTAAERRIEEAAAALEAAETAAENGNDARARSKADAAAQSATAAIERLQSTTTAGDR